MNENRELEQWILSGAVAATVGLDRRVLDHATAVLRKVTAARRWRRGLVLAASIGAVTALGWWQTAPRGEVSEPAPTVGAADEGDEPRTDRGAPAVHLGWPRRLGIVETLRVAPLVAVVVLRAVPLGEVPLVAVRAEVVRVLQGDRALEGRAVVLTTNPWDGRLGDSERTCLCSSNVVYAGAKAVGTHWLMPLKPDGDAGAARPRYRNAVSDGLQGTRVGAAGVSIRADVPVEAVREELLVALRDGVADVRADAAQALRSWEGDPLGGAPGELLWQDADVAKRLLEAGADPEPRVRWTIAWMVPARAGEAGEALLWRLLFDPVRMVRQPATVRLDALGLDAVAVLQEIADYELDEMTSWMLTAQDFGRTGKLARRRSELVAQLRGHEQREIRTRVAWQLGHEPTHPELIAGLTEALSDGNFEVRRGAAWSLGQLGGEPERAVLRALDADPDGRVRVAAGQALDRLGDDGAFERLAALAASDDVRVAVQALEALCRMRVIKQSLLGPMRLARPEALDVLVAALRDDRALVRAFAAAGLPQFLPTAEHQVRALLEGLEQDPSPLVRASAEVALER